MAGPLDEFVARITRMVAAFAQEHGLEQAEVRVELADGSRYRSSRRRRPSRASDSSRSSRTRPRGRSRGA